MTWHTAIAQDFRYALRTLLRSPGFTLTAIATLALGIGINAAVFSVTSAALFKGFRGVDDNSRILYIDTEGRGCCVSYPEFEDWRAQATSFEGLGTVADLRVTLSDETAFPESYTASLVTANAFRLLHVRPILGRDFVAADEMPGAAPVAILSHGFWERRYAGDESVVGQTVRINGAPTTVIGVMPAGFAFPQNQTLWLPLLPTPDRMQRDARGLWFTFARLADGVTLDGARAEMATIGQRLASEYPETNDNVVPVVQRFHEFFIGPDAAAIYGALWGAVGFVLLIACANLANLLLARGVGRSREISVRVALGAERLRIVRQLLVESLVLSGVGGLCGWWLAKWGVRAYAVWSNSPTRDWSEGIFDYSMDYRVFAYVVALSIGAGLVFGLAPALRLSRLDVNLGLKEGGRSVTAGRRGKRLSALLVTAQMALAVVLLAGAGLMARSFFNVYTRYLGFETDNIVTALMSLPVEEYADADAQVSFYARLEARIASIPGIESAAVASSLPGMSGGRLVYEVDGAPPADADSRPRASRLIVSPAYFRAVGAAVLSGREFNDADDAAGLPVAIVNERFARLHWPGGDALGKRLRIFSNGTTGEWLNVVGVSSNIQNSPLSLGFTPSIYVPFRQAPSGGLWVFGRASVPPETLGVAFRREVLALDSDLPIWLGPFTLESRLADAYWARGLYGGLFVMFAAIALLLASVGLYAVIAHSVNQRTQELGVRMALGAETSDVLRLVLRQGLVPFGVGLGVGLVASLGVTRVLESQLVDVSALDPLTYLTATAALVLAAMLGCWIPARRAMRVDPVIALRQD